MSLCVPKGSAELGPSAWELLPLLQYQLCERSAHTGDGGGKPRGRGRRPCGWAGAVLSLLQRVTQIRPGTSLLLQCKLFPGSWRLGWLSLLPRTEARGRGAGGCVLIPSLFPSTGVGAEEVEAGCWVLGAGCTACSTSRLSQALPSTCTAGHQSCWTDDQVMCCLHRRLS